jgi:hypothetical protein
MASGTAAAAKSFVLEEFGGSWSITRRYLCPGRNCPPELPSFSEANRVDPASVASLGEFDIVGVGRHDKLTPWRHEN